MIQLTYPWLPLHGLQLFEYFGRSLAGYFKLPILWREFIQNFDVILSSSFSGVGREFALRVGDDLPHVPTASALNYSRATVERGAALIACVPCERFHVLGPSTVSPKVRKRPEMSSPVYSQIPSTRNEEDRKSSPPGFLSTALFTWLSGIFAQGDLRPLEETDLFQAVDQRKSRDVSEQIQKLWTEETRTSRNPRIWRALLGLVTAREYTFHACSLLLLSLVRVSQPVLLNVLLRELVNEPTDLRWIAVYIVGLALAGVLAAFLKSTFYYAAGVAGAHFSTALTGLVYRKVSFLAMFYA